MGKLVVTEFVSLDGVFEDPGGAAKYVVSNTPTDPGWRGARVRLRGLVPLRSPVRASR